MSLERPQRGEIADYYFSMIDQAPDGDLLENLTAQIVTYREALTRLTPDEGRLRYADGKWSVNEVIGHVIDTEVIMSARALAFARGESQPLTGFDQDEYVAPAHFDERTTMSLVETLAAVRHGTVALFSTYPDEAHVRQGHADGKTLSVRGIGWLLLGHAEHHLKVVRNRYLA